MTSRIRRALTLGAGALALVLTACAAPTADTPPASATSTVAAAHNAADTEFTQMMIVHHEGAIEMADLAVEKASTPEVTALAERIKAAQGPEIERMTGWLTAWGEPTGADTDHGGMDHGGMEMDGMTQAEAMSDLSSRSGTAFDRRFLDLMTAHHQGAITMAEAVIASGENEDVVRLARAIVTAQTAEIAEMATLLEGLRP
ncbi:DUF305 domain-containing protein [Propionicicella superfundia]|uniref:DUF305 domain-containing protein n=1 Tax=Propionicicella superfundia TaxID=348582 RepID=UPI00042826C2|nr:DUF305 domain-containing protein [Propionicicella superfundia]